MVPVAGNHEDGWKAMTTGYGYYWFRHHEDGSTFIACRDDDMCWYMPGVGVPIPDPEKHATMLGKVPRTVVGGGSIDQ